MNFSPLLKIVKGNKGGNYTTLRFCCSCCRGSACNWLQCFPCHSESFPVVGFICFEMQVGIISTRSNCCCITRIIAAKSFKKAGISAHPVVNFEKIFGTIRVRFNIQGVYRYLNNTPSVCGDSPIIIFHVTIVTWVVWTGDDPLNTNLGKRFH